MADYLNNCGFGYGMMGYGFGWIVGSLFIVAMILLIVWLTQQIFGKRGKK